MADVSGLGGPSNIADLLRLAQQGAQQAPGGNGQVGQGAPVHHGLFHGGRKDLPPATGSQQQGGGGSGDMTPDGPDTSASVAMTLAEIRSVSGKASELLNKVLVTQLQQEGNELLQQQLAARQAAKDSLLNAASDLRSQGEDILKGAVTNFAISVSVSAVSMGMTVAGGLSSLRGVGQEAEESEASAQKMQSMASKEESGIVIGAQRGSGKWQVGKSPSSGIEDAATEVRPAVAGVKSRFSVAGDSLTRGGDQMSKLGESSAGFASSMGQYQQKMDEGQEKVDEADAQSSDAVVDAVKDARQKLSDMVDKVVEFIKDIQDAKADMMASVVHKGA